MPVLQWGQCSWHKILKLIVYMFRFSSKPSPQYLLLFRSDFTGVKIRERTCWGDRFLTASHHKGKECTLATATPKWWLLWSLNWGTNGTTALCLCTDGHTFWSELLTQCRASMGHTCFFLHCPASVDTALIICIGGSTYVTDTLTFRTHFLKGNTLLILFMLINSRSNLMEKFLFLQVQFNKKPSALIVLSESNLTKYLENVPIKTTSMPRKITYKPIVQVLEQYLQSMLWVRVRDRVRSKGVIRITWVLFCCYCGRN